MGSHFAKPSVFSIIPPDRVGSRQLALATLRDSTMLNAQPLAWDQARREIERVRPDLAKLFDDLYRLQDEHKQQALKVASAEYTYGESVIHEGKAVLPELDAFPKEFIVARNLPLGIIIKNSCEVNLDESLLGITDAILDPGEFLGLFELADEITNTPNPPRPIWNIRAGVCSINAIPNLATQQIRAKFTRKFGIYVGDLGSNDNALFEQLNRLPPFHEIAKNWRVRIIYFSRSWFDLMLANTPGPIRDLSNDLVRRAWRNQARVRNKDPRPLQKKLRFAASNYGETADAAGLLFKMLKDVLDSRQPFYVPMTVNTKSGPFGDIAEQILGVVTSQNCVLCPAYMAKGARIGYLRLEQLAPAILAARAAGGGIKDRVLEMMNVLTLADQKERRDKVLNGEIASYVELLNHITFQSPGIGSGMSGRPSVYMISFDQRTSSVSPIEFPLEDFYSPHFSTPPNERCAFFRSSVRIDGRILSEMAS